MATTSSLRQKGGIHLLSQALFLSKKKGMLEGCGILHKQCRKGVILMTRIFRSTRGQRIRESYVKRLTNTAKLDYVEKIDRIMKSNRPANHSSDSYLLSYDRYDKALQDLKQSFKRFYYPPFTPNLQTEHLVIELTMLVEKYNEAIQALHQIDHFSGTVNADGFHLIFTTFAEKFIKIGIIEKNDYTLVFDAQAFIHFLKTEDKAGLIFIRQFKLQLIQEYHAIFQESSSLHPFAIKGLIIEEER